MHCILFSVPGRSTVGMEGKKADDGNGPGLGLFGCSECRKTFDDLDDRILHYNSEHLYDKAYNNHALAKQLTPERIQPVCTMTPPPKAVDNEEEKSSDQRQIT